jgi:thioredoxin reductase
MFGAPCFRPRRGYSGDRATQTQLERSQTIVRSRTNHQTISDNLSRTDTGRLEFIKVEDKDGEQTFPADMLFIFIGSKPETEWLPAALIHDAEGFVCVGRDILDLQPDGAARVCTAE